MQTVRRLYVYLLSGVSLGVLLFGLATLLEAVFGQLGLAHQDDLYRSGSWASERLSLALALIGVGAPVWGVHWWFAQRGVAAEREGSEGERRSTVRALYLTVVLVALLAWGATAARDLVREVLAGIVSVSSTDYSYGARPATALAVLLVTASAWAYHVMVRRRDLTRGPLDGPAAWLPRLYVYGIAFVALAIALQTTGDLLRIAGEAIWPVPTYGDDDAYRSYYLADTVSGVAVWTIGWFGHWWYSGRLIASGGWRATSERESRLRLAFFVAVILAGSAAVVGQLSEAASGFLRAALDTTDAGFPGQQEGADTIRIVVVAVAGAIPWAAAWWFHRRRMHDEAAQSGDTERVAAATRLDLHAVALIGLAFGAVGAGWLAGLGIDALLGGTRNRDYWDLGQYLPHAVFGSALWAWRWLPIRARQAADPAGEAASTIRRSFLLVILAGSVIGGVAALALVLYRLFGSILGAQLGGNAVSELSGPIGALLVAVVVAAYHGQVLRRDIALQEAAEKAQQAAPPAEGAVQRTLVLRGPAGADLGAAVDALRAALPPGHTLGED